MNIITKINNTVTRIRRLFILQLENNKEVNYVKDEEKLVILDTAQNTTNLGDEIIMRYVMNVIGPYIKNYRCVYIPTHGKFSKQDVHEMLTAKNVIVCGTNFLSPNIELYYSDSFDRQLIHLRNVILVSCGWKGYKNISLCSKYIYRNIFEKQCYQSLRDNQAYINLHNLGLNNVLNTNCFTMLGLDKKCANITEKKSDTVIFTLSALYRLVEYDISLINILLRNYNEVYFWPQGADDLDYFRRLGVDRASEVKIIDRTLSAYEKFLTEYECDYIGTRLHGGVFALQHFRRSVIIAVDNRAREIGKDTNICVIEYSEINEVLEKLINSDRKTSIHLNCSNVELWQESFKKILQLK